jgi:HSP20 family molecular chaperone IbpA
MVFAFLTSLNLPRLVFPQCLCQLRLACWLRQRFAELLTNSENEGTHMLETPKIYRVTNKVAFADAREAFAEWMTTNEDLVFRPAVEMSEEENEFVVTLLVPGRSHENIALWIAPDMALVKGEIDRGEAGRKKLFRSITFPRSVNPDTVHAEIYNGMLSIRVEMVRAYRGLSVVARRAA